mmetsp:Transcript_43407/g.112425  ORF Transcript_43407/g.112425 Transcript_43407/m.112425 type:complete len:209 (-) Transcript_43407:114-740(-)
MPLPRLCPEAFRKRCPVPSVPTLGKDSPPVLTTSLSNSRRSFCGSSHRQPPPGRELMSSTLALYLKCTPLCSHAATRLSRTSLEESLSGKYLFVSSSSPSRSPTPPSVLSSHSLTSPRLQDANTARRADLLDSEKKSRSRMDCLGSTLHREPPLIRIFFPHSLVRSSTVTCAPARAAKSAAVSPLAPPPMTATRGPAPPLSSPSARQT